MTVPAITKYASSALATISLPPYSVLTISQTDNAVEFSSPAKLSQWLYTDSFLARTWSLTIPAMTSAQKTTLINFWKARKGRVIPFKWTFSMINTLYYVRFGEASLSFESITKDYWSCSFTLSEAHTLEINIVD